METTHPLLKTFLLLALISSLVAPPTRAADTATEKELLAVLRSEAPAADKAITCKRLAIVGSDAAVADLAKLLTDPQLASWARIALEAIPGAASDEALRTAAYSLEGNLLVGTINSIGVRRDAGAVDLLTSRLTDKNEDVASAAAIALGKIGNEAATKALRQSLAAAPAKVRSAIAQGCILCAERLLAAKQGAQAAEIYDEIRKAEVPKPRMIEATRGAILARNQEEGIALLLEQFRSPDKSLFQIALSTAREFPGSEVDKSLAAELAKSAPDRAALLVQAMADRKQTVVLPAVLTAAQRGAKPVRLAAIAALGRVGDESCLASLLKIALEGDKDLAGAAKATLADLPDSKADAQVLALLPGAEGKMYPLLIEVVGLRRIDATPTLIKALDSNDAAVRAAALSALGETVTLQQLPLLVTQAVTPKHSEDAAAAQQALKAAAVRMPDREGCAAELAMGIDRTSSTATKTTLLQTLGAMGGTKALATVGAAARSSDPELQDVSSKLLGEWMTDDAGPVLLDLVKSAPGDKYQSRALRGYIRICRQFVMPDKQRAEMCQKAFDVCRKPDEQRLVLEVLRRYPNKESLKLAIKAIKVPELKNDATELTLFIAKQLDSKGVNVKDELLKAGLDAKL